jgi:hypothetical protein
MESLWRKPYVAVTYKMRCGAAWAVDAHGSIESSARTVNRESGRFMSSGYFKARFAQRLTVRLNPSPRDVELPPAFTKSGQFCSCSLVSKTKRAYWPIPYVAASIPLCSAAWATRRTAAPGRRGVSRRGCPAPRRRATAAAGTAASLPRRGHRCPRRRSRRGPPASGNVLNCAASTASEFPCRPLAARSCHAVTIVVSSVDPGGFAYVAPRRQATAAAGAMASLAPWQSLPSDIDPARSAASATRRSERAGKQASHSGKGTPLASRTVPSSHCRLPRHVATGTASKAP